MSEFCPPLVGAIDQGTQSSRFILFDSKAAVVASHQKSHKQIIPQPGWCEHDPNEIVESVEECVREVMAKIEGLGFSASDIKCVGITNQRETTVVWDKETGAPLHNALVWLDTRTRVTCDLVVAAHGGDRDCLRAKCGLPVSTYFSGMKLRWLLDHVPEVRAAADAGRALFGTIDSWLIYRLTGGAVHVTDVTNASRTMLMNLATCAWDEDLCARIGVPMSLLPEIRSSAEVYGRFADGPLKGVAISACLGDQQSACVGHCAFHPGDSKNTYGTGCFMLVNTGSRPIPSRHGLLSTVCYKLGPDAPTIYALEGSVAIAGVGMSWLTHNLRLVENVGEIEALAATVPDTGGVYLVPAFAGLFAPHWREDARGAMVGLTQFTTRAHVVRAMMEAVCFQTADVCGAMELDYEGSIGRMKVDGGMTANSLLMQLQADILGIEVMRPDMAEATGLGAALAAGLAVGVWNSVEEIEACQAAAASYRVWTPEVEPRERARRKARWADAIRRTLDWEPKARPTPEDLLPPVIPSSPLVSSAAPNEADQPPDAPLASLAPQRE